MALTKVKAGNIILTTPSASSNDVTPATTQYVTTAIGNLIDTAPSTLNTLNELAAALGDDVNFSTTVTNSIATKAPLASPTFTGTPHLSNRFKTQDGSAQMNMGQWDGSNHRIEADSNRPLKIYSYNTSNGIALGISGSDKLTINGDGSGVTIAGGLIGTSATFSPSSGKTFVIASDSGDGPYIGTSGNQSLRIITNNTTRITLLAAGGVGIGEALPDLPLHVSGTVALPATSGSTPTGFISLRAKSAGGSHGLHMGVSNASPWGSWLQAQDANNLANEYPLLLNPNGGNVGIGITAPDRQLEVRSAAANNTIIKAEGTYADGYRHGFEASNTHTGGSTWSMISTNNSDGYFGGGKFVIANEASQLIDANTTAKFVIDASGNVGIGTKVPANAQKLTVTGNIEMTSTAGRRIFMGGAIGGTFGLAYDSSNPNYGIFYTEGSPDRVDISPNGSATAGAFQVLGSGNVNALGTYSRAGTEMGTIIVHDHLLSNVNRSLSASTTAWTDTGMTKTVTPQSAKSYFWVEVYHNEHINPNTPNHGGGLRILGGSTEISRGGEMIYQIGGVLSGNYNYNGNAKTWGGWYNPATASAIVFKAQVVSPTQSQNHSPAGNYYYWHWASNYIAAGIGPRLRIIEFT